MVSPIRPTPSIPRSIARRSTWSRGQITPSEPPPLFPQVHDHPPVLPRRQVLFHLGGKGLHGQLRILPAAVVLDIVGPFIQGKAR